MPLVPLTHLLEWSPFERPIWSACHGPGPITIEEVNKALRGRKFVREPLDGKGSRNDHVRRVAYLVRHPEEAAPISLDVGVPELGYQVENPIEDGHHRLAAAIFRGEQFIEADVSGSIKHAEAWLGIKIPRTMEDRVLEAVRRSPDEPFLRVDGLETRQVARALQRLRRAGKVVATREGHRVT